jgi:signal transduction histidine kinase
MTGQPSIYFDISVLCVEDEPVTLEFLKEMLRPHVRQVLSARDGHEGFFEFARIRPDIVLTDMEMPRMDGLEMGQAIRSLSPITQIVLITGLEDPRILKRGIQLKADGFLSKPVSIQDLLGTLERCNETIRFQREAMTQRKLRELILNCLPYPLALLNTATYQVLFANSEAQLMDITPSEPASGPFFPEPVRREIHESMTLAEKLENIDTTLQIEAAGKTWEISISPVATDTSLYVAVDITARQHLESLKADVERIIRHDLKSPLGAIIGLPDMLLHQSGLSETMVESLTMIRDAGHNMLNQINLSLDLFKMEQGSYNLNPEPVEIMALMREILPQIGQFVRMMQLRVEMQINGRVASSNEHFFVFGEKLLCLSMLSNLLKNAAEASSKGGTITIGLKRVQNGAKITIHNQGAIPAAIRNRLFEKYVTAGKRHGTGLGAYSAALIAKTLGGAISATSSEDAGTTISVMLPSPPATAREELDRSVF